MTATPDPADDVHGNRAARRERRRNGQSAVALPSVMAQGPDQMLTLGELRDLVEAADAQLLPDDVVVRGQVAMRTADIMNPAGMILMRVGLDRRPK
jgi:hypothetical protein